MLAIAWLTLAAPGLVLGTQTIGAKYQFTDQPLLVETAQGILDLGSDLLKIRLEADGYPNVTAAVREDPELSRVLAMPFRVFHFWVYGLGQGKVNWQDGLSADEAARHYAEIHDVAVYLLTTWRGSGREFYLGHWEGDWHLHPGYDRNKTPDPVTVQGMIDWLNLRQQAIDDARREVSADGVAIFGYTEVNLVRKAVAGGVCLTNDVLPHTTVDYVSYSAYDSLGAAGDAKQPLDAAKLRRELTASLDHIAAKLPAKAGLPGQRVWLGEYGFPLRRMGTPARQDEATREVAAIALEWGCPFALYWEFYCNEVDDRGHRGFWMIDDQGVKQPVYDTHRDYFAWARAWLAAHAEPANQAEFRTAAAAWLRAR